LLKLLSLDRLAYILLGLRSLVELRNLTGLRGLDRLRDLVRTSNFTSFLILLSYYSRALILERGRLLSFIVIVLINYLFLLSFAVRVLLLLKLAALLSRLVFIYLINIDITVIALRFLAFTGLSTRKIY